MQNLFIKSFFFLFEQIRENSTIKKYYYKAFLKLIRKKIYIIKYYLFLTPLLYFPLSSYDYFLCNTRLQGLLK